MIKLATNKQNIYQGLHKLDDLIFLVNKPLIGKKGIHYQKLLKDWLFIVGEDLARYVIPIKILSMRKRNISENILYIATNNAASAVELIYHFGVIKEQINFYFGYEYIHQIKLIQAVFQVMPKNEIETTSLSIEQYAKRDNLVSEYNQDDEIKALLIGLATDVLRNN